MLSPNYQPDEDSPFGCAFQWWMRVGASVFDEYSLDSLEMFSSVAFGLLDCPAYADDPHLRRFRDECEQRLAFRLGNVQPVVQNEEMFIMFEKQFESPVYDSVYDPNLREVDQRSGDGYTVTLLVDPTREDKPLFIRVQTPDGRSQLVSCPKDKVRECFKHPFGMLPELV